MGGKSNKGRKSLKEPVERLNHNHRRLELRLVELRQYASEIADGESGAEESWDGVADVLAYLQRSVVRHELDEEESVFPHLAEHPALRPLLQRLRDDHVSQGNKVSELEKLSDARDNRNSTKLLRVTKVLQTLYLDHIKREDRELLPAITRHLSSSQLLAIANEMAERRQDH